MFIEGDFTEERAILIAKIMSIIDEEKKVLVRYWQPGVEIYEVRKSNNSILYLEIVAEFDEFGRMYKK